jgi:hypothetical protein
MSLTALKRKSLTMYGRSHSVGEDGFSLNGKQRISSYNLGRSVTRTPFRGPLPMGHGSGYSCRVSTGNRARVCGNQYPIVIHRSLMETSQTKVKRSTMNTHGMLENKYTGILHGSYPRSVVSAPPITSSSVYTYQLSRQSLACPHGFTNAGKDYKKTCSCISTKDLQLYSHGYNDDYNLRLNQACVKTDLTKVPKKTYHQCSESSNSQKTLVEIQVGNNCLL